MGKYTNLVEKILNESELKDGTVVRILDDSVMGKQNVGRYFVIKQFNDKY